MTFPLDPRLDPLKTLIFFSFPKTNWVYQGWKLLIVCQSGTGTGKNCGGHVNNFITFPKERLKFCAFLLVYMSDIVMDRKK